MVYALCCLPFIKKFFYKVYLPMDVLISSVLVCQGSMTFLMDGANSHIYTACLSLRHCSIFSHGVAYVILEFLHYKVSL